MSLLSSSSSSSLTRRCEHVDERYRSFFFFLCEKVVCYIRSDDRIKSYSTLVFILSCCRPTAREEKERRKKKKTKTRKKPHSTTYNDVQQHEVLLGVTRNSLDGQYRVRSRWLSIACQLVTSHGTTTQRGSGNQRTQILRNRSPYRVTGVE